ncbi:MAG: CinA family protein [Betaproteobacteria bacterium]
MNDTPMGELVEQVAQALERRGWRLATAESCTGGLIAAHCTDRAGSSAWFDRGFITYSNAAKTELLGVAAQDIAREGAVSEVVARAMAEGALRHSPAQVSVAVTGIAGPGGAVPGKPVGTVWLGWALRSAADAPIQCDAQRLQFPGDRAAVRHATVRSALAQVLKLAGS